MKRKIFVFLFFALIAIMLVTPIVMIVKKGKENEKSTSKKYSIEELYEYGDKLEKMDISPNTIVAKFNGEEILFREVETARKQLDFYNGKNLDNTDENAFYYVLRNKLYSQFAKKYPDEFETDLRIDETIEKTEDEWKNGTDSKSVQEYRKEWLDILCIEENEIWLDEKDFLTYLENIAIEQALSGKGSGTLNKILVDDPELIDNKKISEISKKYSEIYNGMIENTEQVEAQNLQEYIKEKNSELYKLKDEAVEILILGSEIELCVNKKELSTKTPKLYSEE